MISPQGRAGEATPPTPLAEMKRPKGLEHQVGVGGLWGGDRGGVDPRIASQPASALEPLTPRVWPRGRQVSRMGAEPGLWTSPQKRGWVGNGDLEQQEGGGGWEGRRAWGVRGEEWVVRVVTLPSRVRTKGRMCQ